MKIHHVMNLDICTTTDIFKAGQQYPTATLRYIFHTTNGWYVNFIVIFNGRFDESLAMKAVTDNYNDQEEL